MNINSYVKVLIDENTFIDSELNFYVGLTTRKETATNNHMDKQVEKQVSKGWKVNRGIMNMQIKLCLYGRMNK